MQAFPARGDERQRLRAGTSPLPALAGVAGFGGPRLGALVGTDAAVAAAGEPAVRPARELKRELRLSFVERIGRCYAEAGAEALVHHEAQSPLLARGRRGGGARSAAGHNLAFQLQNCWESALRFLHEPVGPFTNNQAEQDVRMMNVRQKISGGLRSAKGPQDFATLSSVLSSARKQGRHHLEALPQGPEVLFAGLPPNGRPLPLRPASPQGPPLTRSLQPTSGRSAGLLGQLPLAALSIR